MFYVQLGNEKIPVPRDVEAQGPQAVEAFVEVQKARIAAETKDARQSRRPSREE